MTRKAPFFIAAASLGAILAAMPLPAAAHEVYVLTPQEISQAISMPSPNPFLAVPEQELNFLVWGVMSFFLVIVVLRFSLWKRLERACDPFFEGIKRWAPFISRITLGLSLLASAFYGALFGPELSLEAVAGPHAFLLRIALFACGSLILVGLLTRVAAAAALGIFLLGIMRFHWYLLTYLNYLGEIIVTLVAGGSLLAVDRLFPPRWGILSRVLSSAVPARSEEIGFFVLRLCSGAAIFFASFYAKFLHSSLALDTVADYHLTNYFPFTPLFLVLGAFIVEALIGLFFALGFEVRFAALLFAGFLTLSLLFFGEVVWPHLILFGVSFALFAQGYDRYTAERQLFGLDRLEPIL